MKHLKKVLALVLVGVMMMGMMSVTAFAAEVDRSITVTGLDKGDTVNFYKVLSWADDSKEATDHKAVSGWYFEAPFNTAKGIAVSGDLGSVYLKNAINDKNQLYLTDNMANDLAQALNGVTATPVNATPITVGDDKKATYNFPKQEANFTDYDGLYMAIITPADQDTVYSPVFVHLDSSKKVDSFEVVESALTYMDASTDQSGNIIGGAAKKSKVTLEKESHNSDDYTDSVTETQPNPKDDGDTTKPYDVLTFKVKTTIPGYGDTFDHPAFNITDKMNGMKLMYPGAATGSHKDAEGNTVPDSYAANITVKVGNTEYVMDEADDFDNDVFKITPADGQYKIEFKEDFLKGIHVPTAVEVSYSAKVQEGDNTNVIKEKNTVELEFSHDPTTESEQKPGGDKNYKKDITNHYTFSIDANNLVGPTGERPGTSGSELVKVAVDKNGDPIFESHTWSNVGPEKTNGQQSPLAGAEFKLYGSKQNGDIDKENVIGIATSDASGRINFTGLDAGKYWLEETSAPAGYVKQSGEFPITISATMEEREITEYTANGETWISEAAYNALTAEEKKDYQSYTYKTEELKSYKVTYGTTAAEYEFTHAHEGDNTEIKWSIATSSELPQSILNTKGVELPSTGGMGTTIFYIVGAILVLGAGVVLVTRRRMSVN